METDGEARLRRLFADDAPEAGDAAGQGADAAAEDGSSSPSATEEHGASSSPEPDLAGPWIPADPEPPAAVRPEPGPEPAPATEVVPVVRDSAADDDRRRLLWRDSATILIGVVLALLVVQSMSAPPTAGPGSSPSDLPSGIAIGSVGPPISLPPGATLPPIIDPSLGIDATPTPIPVITMGPTPTPGPSPSPSASPSSSPKATGSPRPSRTPGTSKPPSTPPSNPPPTQPPPTQPPPTQPPPTQPPPTAAPPVAQFTWNTTALVVDFTNTSTGDTSWDWDFGDSSGSTAQNPSHVYAAPGDYTVKLTVTGPGGTDTVTHVVSVSGT